MTRTLVKNGYVVTVNECRDVLPGGAVIVADGRVESVQPSAASFNERDFDEVINAEGCLVMPGLINMHQHHWYCLFKGIADGMILEDWITDLVFPIVSQPAGDRYDVLVQSFRDGHDARHGESHHRAAGRAGHSADFWQGAAMPQSALRRPSADPG